LNAILIGESVELRGMILPGEYKAQQHFVKRQPDVIIKEGITLTTC
jgi:hypothetical protein